MKMSFSLSSLQPSSQGLERAEHARTVRMDRPYNSLTKKRKEPMQDQNSRCFSGSEDGKDDFWAAIRTNYDFIMDTNLIDTCKETNGELAWDEGDVSTVSWGLKEVSGQFSELYSWLRVLQELVYSKEENLLDKSLRAAHTEELRRKAYRRRLFNEQAEKLMARAPSLKEEVSWRVDHLNAKWDLVEQIMSPVQRADQLDDQDISADFEHEVKCLRKWLREMEARLQPLNFKVDWSRTEIEEKAMEHMVLQRDIESHGRIVSSVVKLGERVASLDACASGGDRQQQHEQALRIASSLERRWHLLFLRALEWQCHIEALAASVRTKLPIGSRCSSDTDDEEPVTKQPRLSRRASSQSTSPFSTSSSLSSSSSSSSSCSASSQDESSGGNSSSSAEISSSRRRSTVRARRRLRTRSRGQLYHHQHQQLQQHHHHQSRSRASDFCNGESNSSRSEISSDSEVSSENRFIDDGSYFEDDLDELCATIVKHQPIEICNGTEQRHQWSAEGTGGDQGAEADIEEDEDSPMIVNSTMTPSPANDTHAQLTSIDEVDSAMGKITEQSTMPATQHQIKLDDCTPKRRRTDPSDEAALFNTSNRKSKNCATFYFKHADTDSEADNGRSGAISERHLQKQKQQQQQQQNDSSEEEWTYTPGTMRMESEQKSVRVRLDMDQASDEEQQVEERINEEKTEEKVNGAGGKGDNSDDEAKNDKESIQRLISEVEKLVREEGRVSDRRTTDLIFSEDVKAAASGLLSPQNHRAKYARIKEWLALNSARCREGRCTSQYCLLTTPETLDSCDASGEYTTGESDVEQRQTNPTNAESEEERTTRSSVVSCRLMRRGSSIGSNRPTDSHEQLQQQQEEVAGDSAGASAIGGATPKVIMRSKRSGPRPWSVSCITQISKRANLQTNGGQDDPPSFSISETALHTLISSTPNKAGSLDTAESRAPFNNSTSTLLEETIVGQDARVVRNSSLRRRKNRLRKKNVSRKSESGSDGLSTGGGANGRSEGSDSGARSSIRRYTATAGRRSSRGSCQQQLPHHLVKSGSFSGYSVHDSCTASALVSNSSNISGVRRSGSGDGPLIQVVPPRQSSSESEDDEEEGLDAATAAVVGTRLAPLPKLIQRGLDSDVEKNSLGHNSYSEQAWDNYQEKYMSEPYSEAADIESARRLLEFCDDYRNFIDSQSDCASSLSAVRHRGNLTSEDSDSDLEFKRLAETSRTQLMVSEARYRTISDTSFSELTRVCRENIRCLRAIGEANGVSRHADKHAKQIRGLMERWESLSLRAEEAQKINSIHREMSAMKLEFCAAFERIMCYQVVLEEPHIIEERISRITNELANLRDRKPAMLALNVSTHRLITDFGQKSSPTFAALKDGVADLYRLWDEAFQKGNQKLCALQAVQQFGIRLSEFQCALRRDKDTLAVLDAALQAGATMEVASSVRDVARLLSEKHDANDQQQQSLSSLTSEESLSRDDSGNCTSGSASLILDSSCLQLSIGSGGMTLLEGGSLSDSGISDSGSEQELSERERRLAALRRLTRGLEAQLQPGSELLTELTARIEDAEAELRLLQAHCRELIVRTAASVDARVSSASDAKSTATNAMQQASFSLPTKWKKVSSPKAPIPKGSSPLSRTPGCRTASDDPDSEPSVPPRSWVWRILRAALPFQLALLVLLCAACLLEPHCCEASNSLGLSLTPQLRYVRGPPPV